MFDLILNNKEWLFSGGGVAILFFLVPWIIKKIKSRKTPEPSLNGASLQDIIDAPPPPKQKPIPQASSLTPKKIFEDIKSASLLQRPEMRKHYEGISVTWTGTLFNAKKINEKIIHLQITVETEKDSTSVFFNINPNKYPGIGLLREGHKIKVEGKITKVEDAWIILNAENIEYNVADLG